ncbi:[histone H3]-lysine(4) N-trimethyltransferase [Malassezia cuniculi]|uniref:Histone-lysine N-methyltransferase, H3 lysine-4 specific n=1 Tax=Malassezia cuniculi TaxID=948313 RepID=A0AAF0ER98_9BASI|nr:[histone H3]-lysine(4) N-trimethyltransferase [Malassezia cuniculi]
MSRLFSAGAGMPTPASAPAAPAMGHSVPLPHQLPHDPRLKNYQTTYDPQLDPTHRSNEMHRRYELEKRQDTADPRTAPDYCPRKPRRRAREQLEQCVYAYDKNSVGPPPPRELVIHGLSPRTMPAAILQHCRAFGRVEASELKVDPQTGESIGIFWLKYAAELGAQAPSGAKYGYEAARAAKEALSGSRIGPSVVTAELDTDKERYVRMYRTELGKRYPPKAVIEARKAEARRAARREEERKEEAQREVRREPRREEVRRSRWDVGSRDAKSTVLYGKRDAAPRMSRYDIDIHERLAKLGRSYIFVPRVSVDDAAVKERFRAFSPVLFERGDDGWYVGFEDDVAVRCQRVLNDVRVGGQLLRLEVHNPQRPSRTEAKPAPPKKTHWTPEELQEEAMQKIMSELEVLFLRDVKNRIVAPRIAEFLRPDGVGGVKLAEHRERQERDVRPSVAGALPSFRKVTLDPIPRKPGAPPSEPRKPKRATIDYSDDSDEEPDQKPQTKTQTEQQRHKQAPEQDNEPVPDVRAAGIVCDDEEAYFLKVALEKEARGQELPPLEDDSDEDDMCHRSGSARAEGFYKIPPERKAAHLPDRNRAIVEPRVSSLASARNNRADSRRLAHDIEQHKRETLGDTDILKFNQLRTRKKQLRFAKSPIHDWGLYAMEVIPPGDMVIEYVGEIVRQQVADHREKMYERAGNFSTYLFRVDDDIVVDATMKGNIARLMNHCCTPNCTAKILTVNGEKRIGIFAKQQILPGQELTYDYKFQASAGDEDAIPCLCGSPACRRFL